MRSIHRLALVLATMLVVPACSSSSDGGSSQSTPSKSDEAFKQAVTTAMHDSILVDIQALKKATEDLAAAAPTPAGRGWDRTLDAAAIASMKEAWSRARSAYEHVEGALAPIFPDIDASIDERYDGFLETLGAAGDANPFDDQGVTGLHAVERILWSDTIPAPVLAFEKTLPGYQAARIPATEQEALELKSKLCAKLAADVASLESQWTPAKIDIGSAYQGLVGLMNEQKEKVNNAAEGAEESRYSQETMRDIRNNLEGTKKIYLVFQPWIASKEGGSARDAAILRGFEQLTTLYAGVPGDAIPAPPATWSAEAPSAADLGTPFGVLYSGVKSAADATSDSSVVGAMNGVAEILGFAALADK
jgi:iron uptake system component EfeO